MRRVELLTSALRTQRSAKLSYIPKTARFDLTNSPNECQERTIRRQYFIGLKSFICEIETAKVYN